MILKDYKEIVGTLEKYKLEEDKISLVFQIQQAIELLKNAILKDELDDCINRKIGIFNNKGDYRLKKFPRPIDEFKAENCTSCGKRNQCSKDVIELFYCI